MKHKTVYKITEPDGFSYWVVATSFSDAEGIWMHRQKKSTSCQLTIERVGDFTEDTRPSPSPSPGPESGEED